MTAQTTEFILDGLKGNAPQRRDARLVPLLPGNESYKAKLHGRRQNTLHYLELNKYS